MRQAWTAKPRPQLKAVLQRLVVVVIIVGGVLHDDGVIAYTDFSPLFVLGLPFPRDLDPARRRLRLGDELLQVILQRHKDVNNSTPCNDYSTRGVRLLTSFGGRAAEYS
jgi:hypothetical protein